MFNKLNWDFVGRGCIYLLFGLVPVFFLPLTASPVAENKEALGGILVFAALGSFLASTLGKGAFSIAKTRFWFAFAAFFAIIAVSTLLSSSQIVSFWGQGASGEGFFNFLIYGLALFLVPLLLRESRHLIRALLFFSGSLFAVSAYSLLQFFGVFVVPLDFTKSVSFNPIGSVQALAIFLGSGLVMIMALITSFKLSGLIKFAFSIAGVLLALILIFVNFSYVWLGILFASALVASWQIMHSRRQGGERGNTQNLTQNDAETDNVSGGEAAAMLAPKFGLPLVLMIIVAILFFAKPPVSSFVQFPASVRPSVAATFDIAQSTLSASPKNAALGSGPSTFVYEYLLHRSPELNSTAFWGVRFVQGFAAIPSFLVTMGTLGLASLLVMLGFFAWTGFKGVANLSRLNKGNITERVALVSFVSFLFLLSAWFFYPANFTNLLFTFLFAGLLLAALRVGGALDSWDISLLKTPQRTFVASLFIIVFIVGSIVGIYWQGQRYTASLVHARGVEQYNKKGDLSGAIEKVNLATNLDGSSDAYWRTLSQLIGLRAQEILNRQDLASAELQRQYQVLLQTWIQAGQRATQANPADPLNWRNLGSIYENNIRIVGGADQFAISNYLKAAELNPQNPSEYLNVGRAYVLAADALQTNIGRLTQEGAQKNKADIEKLQASRAERLASALENLNKAISLKNDYAPAHFLASQVYERQGNRALAIQKTLETRNLNTLDTGVGYQLGLLYYLDEQFEKARDELTRVVALSESFSNARYFLGLSHDNLGNTQGAIDQFVRISELNPDNAEVGRILSNLRAGRDALEGISPPRTPPTQRIEPPVEDTGGEESELIEQTDEEGAEEEEE